MQQTLAFAPLTYAQTCCSSPGKNQTSYTTKPKKPLFIRSRSALRRPRLGAIHGINDKRNQPWQKRFRKSRPDKPLKHRLPAERQCSSSLASWSLISEVSSPQVIRWRQPMHVGLLGRWISGALPLLGVTLHMAPSSAFNALLS